MLDEKHSIFSTNYGAYFTAYWHVFPPFMGLILQLIGMFLMRNIVSFPPIMGLILQLIGMFFDEKYNFLSTNYVAYSTAYWHVF